MTLPSVRAGLDTLRANPLRTLLSTLGVIMGAASLVAVLSLGDGAEAFARQRILQEGYNHILIEPIASDLVDGQRIPRASVTVLTAADAEAIAPIAGTRASGALAAQGATRWTPPGGGAARGLRLIGVSPVGGAIPEITAIVAGRLVTPDEARTGAEVCVVSRGLAMLLVGASPAAPSSAAPSPVTSTAASDDASGGSAAARAASARAASAPAASAPAAPVSAAPEPAAPSAHEPPAAAPAPADASAASTSASDAAARIASAVGRTLTVDGHAWRIVGVQEDVVGDRGFAAVAPLARAEQVLVAPSRRIVLEVAHVEEVRPLTDAVRTWADTRPGWKEGVRVSAPGQRRLEELSNGILLFKMLMGAFTAIALIVGGIGIMNVLLASVVERTREIGIRKAVGARRRDIVTQFLTESVAIASAGCLLGLALGLGGAFGMTAVMRARTAMLVFAGFSWQTLLASAGAALAVGLVFGTYPALRASRLSPIDAITRE